MSALNPYRPGLFISLEGIDGAGKSTQLQTVVDVLRAANRQVMLTREPGGTEIGEKIRELLLHETMRPATEALLMFAARQEHVLRVIEPALLGGTDVVCDRFTAATLAYQGGGKGIPTERLEALARWVHPGLCPDCIILIDVPPEVAAQRLEQTRQRDRFEQESVDFFARVRANYLQQAASSPEKWRVIDGTQTPEAVQKTITGYLNKVLQEFDSK
ncbi:thymidylate kinase [Thiomonas arsenitoxydans]|uniref:Thymidylate kinase n=1 Tax=Thiomonas arsenitoxydans (strain DSM 22701 / CIP 110005 / 3As) TaxID=426114 RepID=D6CTC4_THIA3|nr:dTMP kinase [Thiomonas arsenitoxydans]CAZ88543.1 putative thymidylate kinase [Thiomonas arsenitoxydans]CQR27551.1 thymidylate kinase [Thiomonas arsenitoxydans]CQR32375.1 thymidylate kinase [Thiomonas arsenitoxydans]CQR34428.1 thymidylate kinase [Thiomonas arsenitoxydans]CQR34505.1 thymidylate kinase [Thiomonas arsenitoxydans]